MFWRKKVVSPPSDITPICGYKDLRGTFHPTVEQAQKANKKIKLDRLWDDLSDTFNKEQRNLFCGLWRDENRFETAKLIIEKLPLIKEYIEEYEVSS